MWHILLYTLLLLLFYKNYILYNFYDEQLTPAHAIISVFSLTWVLFNIYKYVLHLICYIDIVCECVCVVLWWSSR